jgi:hypothetical protein
VKATRQYRVRRRRISPAHVLDFSDGVESVLV